MANTHGFELIIQTARAVIVKALKGAWKSAECPDQPDDTGRIPEFMDIPNVGDIGGFPIIDGQVQIPMDELDADFAPEVNGITLTFGLNIQIEIGNPPVPSARLLDFHTILRAKSPVGTLPDTQDVGVLLADINKADVSVEFDQGHPLDNSIEELLQDYVHKAYENGEIPNFVSENEVPFAIGTVNTTTQIFDDEANVDRQILSSFPDATTLRISIPIYLRMFAFVPDSFGPITIASPMGIETRIIINAPFEKYPDRYEAKFGSVSINDVSVGPIDGVKDDIAGNPNEAINYQSNKSNLPIDIDTVLTTQLKQKGMEFANDLGNQRVDIPAISEMETLIADLFYDELTSRNYLAIWSPTASDDEFEVDNVEVRVFSDTMNIALNAGAGADSSAITNFIPAGMEFSIAMSRSSLDEKIAKARTDGGFDDLPKRFVEDGKDVDLNTLNITVVDFSIRLTGTLTVIDAVLGSIDVDASFTTNVGFHWEPSGDLNADGFQKMQHELIGEPDVDVDEGIAFWILAIILTIISFGVGGVLVGIITIIVVLIVKAIVENIGSDSLVDGATGAINGITAWPPQLAHIGAIRAVFFDPIEISTSGLVMSGQMEVISSCESTLVVPATTAGKYTTKAAQLTELKALKIYNHANFFWNPGDGSASQLQKTIYHSYDVSGIYLAKHGVQVTEFGGASSRHFAIVRVKNVPAIVTMGPNITVNEGEAVTLEANFEDVEYSDTHWSLWNFGDDQSVEKGFVVETNTPPASRGVARVEHAWCDNGEYTVTVQIIDQNGGVGTASMRVTVLNVAPVVRVPERMYAYRCNPITMVGVFTDSGWCDTHTGTWSFGDCSPVKTAKIEETNEAPEARGSATASHVYDTCGRFVTECSILDDDGGLGQAQSIIEVTEIYNANFNDGFSFHPLGEIANHWLPFGIAPDQRSAAAGSSAFAIFGCDHCIVADGLSAQRITGLPGANVGIYQQIKTNRGWTYQVELLYMLLNNNGHVRLGLDSWGGTDPENPDIVWCAGDRVNLWSHLLERVCAETDRITVFIGLVQDLKGQAVCSLDSVSMIAMQDISCVKKAQPVPDPRNCLDFRSVSPKEELPSDWNYEGVRFMSITDKRQRIVKQFPPSDTTCLEIDRGLLIEFYSPVNDLCLKLCYREKLTLGVLLSNVQGKVISQNTYELQIPTTTLHLGGSHVYRVQLIVRENAGLSELCFGRSKQENEPIYLTPKIIHDERRIVSQVPNAGQNG